MISSKKKLDFLHLRARLLREFHGHLPEYCHLPDNYALDIETSHSICSCGCRLQRKWLKTRKVIGILLGKVHLRHHIKRCPQCKKVYPYEHLRELLPPNCNYAYDIMVEIGLARYLQKKQNGAIQRYLSNRYRIPVPSSTINVLADRFLTYFATVHYAHAPTIRRIIAAEGGYPLYLDGTCEAGTEVLFSLVHGIHKWVLVAGRIPTENIKDITRLLQHCVSLYGEPVLTLRDLSEQIKQAIQAVFPGKSDLVCHYHFLLNVGKKLLYNHHFALTKRIRSLKIPTSLHSLRHSLMKNSKNGPPMDEDVLNMLRHTPQQLRMLNQTQLRRYFAYLILQWLKDFEHDLKGEYFPFDLPYLTFYRRCQTLYDLLSKITQKQIDEKARNTFVTIAKHVSHVREDQNMRSLVKRLEKSEKLFKELRTLLSMKNAKKKSMLRQTKPLTTIEIAKNMEARLSKFRKYLSEVIDTEKDSDMINDAKITLQYLEKYWENLFGHVVILSRKTDPIVLERTNNVLEAQFAHLKHDLRLRIGTKKVNRLLNAMRADQLLVTNIKHQRYLDILYNGSLDNMAKVFGKYWEMARKKQSMTNNKNKSTFCVSKKTLRKSDFLQNVAKGIERVLSNAA